MTTIDDCQPGDRILINLPCEVTITKITGQDGNEFRGNRRVDYTDPKVFWITEGHIDIGSMVAVTLLPQEDE